MATIHLPDDGLRTAAAPSARAPGAGRIFLRGMVRTGGRMVLNTVVYLTAALLGLSVGPLLFLLADRPTALHWANAVLDFVSR